MARFGLLLIVTFIFLLYGRPHDHYPFLRSLHLTRIVLSLALVAVVFSGRWREFLKFRVGWLFAALTVWFVLGIPFSAWPGGTVELLMDRWAYVILLFGLITAFAVQVKDVLAVALSLLAGISLAAVFGVFSAASTNYMGRQMLSRHSLGDPNELALVMLMGICLCLYVFQDRVRPPWQRWPALGMAGLMSLAAFRTGSRGGMLASAVVVLYIFWRSSWPARFRLAMLGALATMVAIALAPREVLLRYATTFESSSELEVQPGSAKYLTAAESSASARIYLFRRSLEITASHPIFGVGAGMFQVVENDLAKADGMNRGAWHATHNTYTQFSSEGGLPALAMAVGILVLTWRSLKKTERLRPADHPRARQIALFAFWFRTLMLGWLVAASFLSLAYQHYIPIIAGIAFSLERAVARERALLASRKGDSAAAEVAPQPAEPEYAIPRV